MRSYLFVPGNDENKIVKAFDTDADAVILDLEDSVAPSERNKARGVVCDALEALTPDMRKACPKPFVRVNPLGDGEAFRRRPGLDALEGTVRQLSAPSAVLDGCQDKLNAYAEHR